MRKSIALLLGLSLATLTACGQAPGSSEPATAAIEAPWFGEPSVTMRRATSVPPDAAQIRATTPPAE